MGIGRAGEHPLQKFCVEDIRGIRQVLRYFLLNGPALLVPEFLVCEKVLHADCLHMEGYRKVVGRDSEGILRNSLLGVGAEIASHGRSNARELTSRKSGAAAKHHMLSGMGHAGKALRCLIGSHKVVYFSSNHRSESVSHNYHPKAVLQGGAEHTGILVGT